MELNERKEFFVSWEDLHRTTKVLAKRLMPNDQWDAIIAVSRGGLVPGAILARELNIRMIDTICISSYDNEHQRELKVLKDVLDDSARLLVVDDLVDTGETAKVIREKFPKATFVAVYAKPQGKALVDKYVIDVDQDTWINLPWDMELSYVDPLAGE
ncbi:xanthine phosphoribosyltransferase [Algicola sagamiensis]|uniref:xanthine phosphoribosyltransferase n=1 Tax=Algicola sagamiensis TaxID=163869 RepID=UPI00036B70AB|nr:xanthine phosphoribosyltransferase [Algicola sagamiensis]